MRDLEDEIRGSGVTLMGIGSLTDVSCITASFAVYLWWQVKCYFAAAYCALTIQLFGISIVARAIL